MREVGISKGEIAKKTVDADGGKKPADTKPKADAKDADGGKK